MSIESDLKTEIEMLNMTREAMAKRRRHPIVGNRTFYQLTRLFENNITYYLKLKYGGKL